jgi:2,3-bisphosphoglycerate-dependent phosphoglycerate mutase
MAAVYPFRRATLVLLRHGHSAGNAAGTFTGWLDVPLTERGRREAERAGELLLEHGCPPGVIHSSVLVRALDTAEIVADVLARAGAARPAVRPDPRLNERHYGALQGLARADVRARYGDERYRWWRRGYRAVPPPLTDPSDHPPSDPRHTVVPAAMVPNGESLADVRARVEAWWPLLLADLDAHRVVLVVGHSNSLRALRMVLDDLGEAEVEECDVPTGVPLRYELGAEIGADLRPLRRGGVYLDAVAARAGLAEVRAQGYLRS